MQLTILEEPNEERYLRCHLVEEFRIFNIVIDKEEAKMYEILITIGQDLQKLQPVPPQRLQEISISALGSVKGKYEGRKRILVSLPNISLAKNKRACLRSANDTFLST